MTHLSDCSRTRRVKSSRAACESGARPFDAFVILYTVSTSGFFSSLSGAVDEVYATGDIAELDEVQGDVCCGKHKQLSRSWVVPGREMSHA